MSVKTGNMHTKKLLHGVPLGENLIPMLELTHTGLNSNASRTPLDLTENTENPKAEGSLPNQRNVFGIGGT